MNLTVSTAFAKKSEELGVTVGVRTISLLSYQQKQLFCSKVYSRSVLTLQPLSQAVELLIQQHLHTVKEDNAIYYIRGYVVHELKKRTNTISK